MISLGLKDSSELWWRLWIDSRATSVGFEYWNLAVRALYFCLLRHASFDLVFVDFFPHYRCILSSL